MSVLLIAGAADAAIEPGLPTNVCSENFCGPAQARIWNRFLEFSGLDYERAPGVYSGVCYHKSPGLDGNRVHHGGILIERERNRLFFDGRFSFYTDSNPYTHLSMASARRRFDKHFNPRHQLDAGTSFAFVELKDRLTSRRYWFRQNRIRDRLVLVGYFGPLHTILCDMRRNAS